MALFGCKTRSILVQALCRFDVPPGVFAILKKKKKKLQSSGSKLTEHTPGRCLDWTKYNISNYYQPSFALFCSDAIETRKLHHLRFITRPLFRYYYCYIKEYGYLICEIKICFHSIVWLQIVCQFLLVITVDV